MSLSLLPGVVTTRTGILNCSAARLICAVHMRSARNPSAPSYKDKPLAKHYNIHHPGTTPKLSVQILEKASSTNNRKIREARIIGKTNPNMNDRNEQIQIRQFLV